MCKNNQQKQQIWSTTARLSGKKDLGRIFKIVQHISLDWPYPKHVFISTGVVWYRDGHRSNFYKRFPAISVTKSATDWHGVFAVKWRKLFVTVSACFRSFRSKYCHQIGRRFFWKLLWDIWAQYSLKRMHKETAGRLRRASIQEVEPVSCVLLVY